MSARGKAAVAAVLIAAALAPAAGWASASASSSPTPISVAAAFELTTAFPAIDGAPEYSFGDSTLLANSLSAGAPEDVFAGAAPAAQALAQAGTIAHPVTFATTRMVLIVPPGNPGHVAGVSTLARRGVSLALGRPGFSFGDNARALLTRLHLQAAAARARGLAKTPQALVAAVAASRVDAALVYAADIGAAARRVRVIALPATADPVMRLEIAVVTSSSQPAAAAAFVREVLSPAGRAALRAAGLGTP